MSHRIARLLSESEKTVTDLIAGLEKINGHPRHDVRHIADTHQKTRAVLKELGLDADDTTPQELFHALRAKFQADAQKFDAYYKTDQMSFDEKVNLAARLIKQNIDQPKLWVLKKSVAKELLRQHPPKHVLKSYHYRSIQSLLKHENILEIYLATAVVGSASWRKSQSRLVSKLDQTAFELRGVTPIALKSEKWSTIETTELVVSSDDVGALAILPGPDAPSLPLMQIVLLLAEGLSYYGAEFKQVYGINSLIGWWATADGLLAELDGQPVSLNLGDVAASSLALHTFNERQTAGGQKNYWLGLLRRYANHEQAEALFDSAVIQKVRNLKFKAPEPAFEYDFAEEEI